MDTLKKLVFVLILAACGSDPTAPPPKTIAIVEPVRPSETAGLVEPGQCKPLVWICNDRD